MLKRFLEDYDGREYDVTIIGGGITGAALAYDAASRGLRVALLEKSDFGSQTSAATSKLIHGGLRYLATGEIGLIRESLKERRILENIAPNLVYPIPFMSTTNKNKITSNKWLVKLAMIIYDILSFDKGRTWDKSKKLPTHHYLSPAKTLDLEPNVKKEDLTGSYVYYDCACIFPERLTLAFIKSAVNYGAEAANYAKVEGFVFDAKRNVIGVKVKDLLKNKELSVKAAITVNCGGPWADIILDMAKKNIAGEHIRRSEGIHIIARKLVNWHAVTSITRKGRYFFVVPWRGHSLIGTTDKEFKGNPDNYKVTRESIQELLDDVNNAFGTGSLIKYEDVLYAYGGLRPLVEKQTEGTYVSTRKYEIYDNKKDGLNGLITIEGGKYTTSRRLAEKVVKLIKSKVRKPLKPLVTDKKFLYGCEIKDMGEFIDKIKKENKDFSEKTIEYLGRNYGTEFSKVLEIARENKELAQPLNRDGEILAEAVYAARYEMAKTLNDIVLRRTGFGTLGDPGDGILKKIAVVAAKELNWDNARMNNEIAITKKALQVPA